MFTLSIILKTLKNPSKGGGGGKGGIKPFNAFCMSLASCVGTGNLAGVATAICVGGPGAMFWMCVMAVFASALSFAECSLAQLYKRKGKGCFYGGPAYYMTRGLKWAPMGVAFALALMVIMNMTALWLMYGKVSRLIEDFIARYRRGDEIVLDPGMFPGEVLEGWEE